MSTILLMKDDIGMVEYFTFPGDRKRYFKISIENWKEHLDQCSYSNSCWHTPQD